MWQRGPDGALERRGVRCRGFDQSDAALGAAAERGLDVGRLDIVDDPPPDRADLAVSTEVAEHLPNPPADRFVELLTYGRSAHRAHRGPARGGARTT